MTPLKHIARAAAIVGVAGAALVGATSSANAAYYTLSGETNNGGHVVTYSTYRQHSYGSIALSVWDGVTNGARYAMVSQNGNQLSWSNYMYTGSKGWSNVLTGRYAMRAQQSSCSTLQRFVTGCDRWWGGGLTI